MEKFSTDAVLSKMSMRGVSVESEKSGCKMKLIAALDKSGMEPVVKSGKHTHDPVAGKMTLKSSEGGVTFACSGVKVTEQVTDNKLGLSCETWKPFSSGELDFLGSWMGHEVRASFVPDQKEMFDGEE